MSTLLQNALPVIHKYHSVCWSLAEDGWQLCVEMTEETRSHTSCGSMKTIHLVRKVHQDKKGVHLYMSRREEVLLLFLPRHQLFLQYLPLPAW